MQKSTPDTTADAQAKRIATSHTLGTSAAFTSKASVYRHESRPNPFGIRPLGNMLLDGGSFTTRNSGLGAFSGLDDHLLLELIATAFSCAHPCSIETMFTATEGDRALNRLAQTSRAWYCLVSNDGVWRQRTISRFGGNFKYMNSWRDTFKYTILVNQFRLSDFIPDQPLRVSGMYSDLLYTSWRCATVPLDHLCGIGIDNISRRNNLSLSDFLQEYAKPNLPVILTDVVREWPAFKKWSTDFFMDHHGSKTFKAEAVDISFANYAEYARHAQEEAPLYLFDKGFTNDTFLSADYVVPKYFSQDLFQVLGDNRPDYRWLIIGPARSGSTFHIDPNSTSAWNAVITGAKKWILYPPECIPPGVFPSKDGSNVTSPVSLAEWFMNYYQEIHSSAGASNQNTKCTPKPIECICRAGEMIFVPNGWWHCVMNLTDSIAITQNFVSSENLVNVLDFLEFKPDQVSGFCNPNPYSLFFNALKEKMPNVLEEAQASRSLIKHENSTCTITKSISHNDQTKATLKQSMWHQLTAQSEDTADSIESGGGFTFNFEI
ncbi:hypothetical protein MT418_000782 [Batrachochytrium dendrobatidis]